MATEKAVAHAKKNFYRMILCPLNGESIRKCVKGNNLLVRSEQLIKFMAILKPDVCIISGRHICAPREEHKYGVPLVSPINFCYIFWRTTQQRKTAQTWDLASLLIYRYSIISEILSFRHSTVLILVFDGVTVKTTKITTFFSNCILLLRCLSRITVPSTSKNNVPKDCLSRQVSWNREK